MRKKRGRRGKVGKEARGKHGADESWNGRRLGGGDGGGTTAPYAQRPESTSPRSRKACAGRHGA